MDSREQSVVSAMEVQIALQHDLDSDTQRKSFLRGRTCALRAKSMNNDKPACVPPMLNVGANAVGRRSRCSKRDSLLVSRDSLLVGTTLSHD